MDDDQRTVTEQQEHPALLYKSHWVDLVETHSSVPLNLTSVGAGALPMAYEGLVEERNGRDEEVAQIVTDYCLSRHALKEICVEKEVYGWQMIHLEAVSGQARSPNSS